jgi:aminoglycoside phosphotransferase (APT) family kinase protein
MTDPATDGENRWKEELHAQWNTPIEVMDRLVLQASGSGIALRSRIVGGEGNEVWSIITRTEIELIVRVSRKTSFAAEQWAADQARSVGVPAPEILLVDNAVTAGEEQVAVWIHRKISGQPLDTVQNEGAARRLTEDAGELLARIHTVVVADPIDEQGRALLSSFRDVLVWDDLAADAALANGLSRADVEFAHSLAARYDRVWADPPRLLHGDWLPEHVLVREGSMAGIIDFEGARSGDPAYDIAYWQYFSGTDRFPGASLLEGYRRIADVGAELDLRFNLCRLGLSMRAVSYYTQTERAFPAQHAARRFSEALGWLCSHAS